MRLNHDCVRSILLECESLPYNHYFDKEALLQQLNQYETDDILYSILKLKETQYLNISIQAADNLPVYDFYLTSLTWEGHKFLDTIRDDKVWSDTKKILSKVSSASISFTSQVASQVLSQIILHSMGMK